MANIILPKYEPDPAAEAKSGEYYDNCPSCGTRDIERHAKLGGRDGHGEEYLHAALYSCDQRKGGCGRAWSRTTQQGVWTDHQRGIRPKWKTASAAAERVYFMPTETWEREYRRIFGHD